MTEVTGFDVVVSLEDQLKDYRRHGKRIKALQTNRKKLKETILKRIALLPDAERRQEVKNLFTKSEYVTVGDFIAEVRREQRRTGFVVSKVRQLIRLKTIAAETVRGLFTTVVDIVFLDQLIKKGIFTQQELTPCELPRKPIEKLLVKLDGEEAEEDLEESWDEE